MLSKAQARFFFVGGTVLFSLVFLLLTVDTIRQVPAQTRAHKMTAAVKRGKLLWDINNCMGCHTLLGEGAYYAPELTKVVERRGKMWMKLFLRDPQAMFPGERKMVNYKFTSAQIDDLIAFFDWIGKMDLNGFPPKPGLKPAEPAPPRRAATRAPSPIPIARKIPDTRTALTPPVAVARPAVPARPIAVARPAATSQPSSQPTTLPAARVAAVPAPRAVPRPVPAPRVAPAPVVVKQPAQFALCRACHMLGGTGGRVGPALDGVGKKYSVHYLEKWLSDPQAVKPGTKMPKLPFTKQELADMVAYLSSLK